MDGLTKSRCPIGFSTMPSTLYGGQCVLSLLGVILGFVYSTIMDTEIHTIGYNTVYVVDSEVKPAYTT